jgi:GDPmannose 4,6-dehydratase
MDHHTPHRGSSETGDFVSQVALITGITGQDGSYLAEFLLEKGYDVHGLVPPETGGAEISGTIVHYGDLSEGRNLVEILDAVQPQEVYNLAAQSHVGLSIDKPIETALVTGLGALRMLEAVRQYRDRNGNDVRFFQASSSEIFGRVTETYQTETTPILPRNPYACAKAFAYWQTVNYREYHNLFTCNGILFNHESPRRPDSFVTRKITRAAARIKLELQESLSLGNLDAGRDWGFAGDYVRAMWLMLNQDQADDFVIATGETHSLHEFLDEAFGYLDLNWNDYVTVDPKLVRPAEEKIPCGDPSKAKQLLNWQPKVTFRELARMMINHDLKLAEAEKRQNFAE